MGRSRGLMGNLAGAPAAKPAIDMSRLNSIIAAAGKASPQAPSIPSGIGKNEMQAMLDKMKHQALAGLGIGGTLQQEDTSVASEDIDGISGILSKIKSAMKDFTGYEIRTVKTNVGYNGKDVPGYEIRVVMRMVSEQGKAMAPAPQSAQAPDMATSVNSALAQLQNMTPEQIKTLAAQAQAAIASGAIAGLPQAPKPANPQGNGESK